MTFRFAHESARLLAEAVCTDDDCKGPHDPRHELRADLIQEYAETLMLGIDFSRLRATRTETPLQLELKSKGLTKIVEQLEACKEKIDQIRETLNRRNRFDRLAALGRRHGRAVRHFLNSIKRKAGELWTTKTKN